MVMLFGSMISLLSYAVYAGVSHLVDNGVLALGTLGHFVAVLALIQHVHVQSSFLNDLVTSLAARQHLARLNVVDV